MTWYTYPTMVALDQAGSVLRSGYGEIYSTTDTSFVTPLAITDLNGLSLTEVHVNDAGLTEAFRAEEPEVFWKSGSFVVHLSSPKGMLAATVAAQAAAEAAAQDADEARVAAQSASVPVGGSPGQFYGIDSDGDRVWMTPPSGGSGSGISGAPSVWPNDFTPSSHSHLVSELRRSIGSPPSPLASLILALLNATTEAQARTAIGAGTGNGNSNLTVGTEAGQAMSATKTFKASEIGIDPISGLSASTVQAALAALVAAGGSGGGAALAGTVVVRRYASGAYPVRGTLPAGTPVMWIGPVQPTTGGNYVQVATDFWLASPA